MIYRCSDGHISFSNELLHCGKKGCNRPIDAISDRNLEWFYRISPTGLAIDEKDLHKIIGDKNIPEDAKNAIREVFPKLKRKRNWFG